MKDPFIGGLDYIADIYDHYMSLNLANVRVQLTLFTQTKHTIQRGTIDA